MKLLAASHWAVGVVIPACDEAASIERCLRSVIAACDGSARCEEAWIVVVADDCTDATAALARRTLERRGEVVECRVQSPGSARRRGARAVLEHFHDLDPQHIWLANTDADTHVPKNWLATHLLHADENAGGVAGIVELDPVGLRPDVEKLHRRTYLLAADGTHAHVHGANLGVRGDAYLDVGGWSDVTVSEDHCLWGRLRGRGWRLQSPTASVVSTSPRLQGRARGGFADTLARGLFVDE